MSKISIYLNFMGKTEEAFNFYKSVFGGEFSFPITRIGAGPTEHTASLSEEDKNKVMHVALPILDNIEIMGTDMIESMGHKISYGNNVSLNIEVETKEEAEKYFTLLSAGGSEIEPLQEMFWGALWAAFVDKYSVRWMINQDLKK